MGKKKKKKKEPKRVIPQLNVRPFPTVLLKQLNAVIGATGQTQAEFIVEALEGRIKEHKQDIERIQKREATRAKRGRTS